MPKSKETKPKVQLTQLPPGKVKVVIRKTPRCLVCSEPVAHGGAHGLCGHCIDRYSYGGETV